MDRTELKVKALLERVSNLTTEYENKVADLRVELTVVSQERDAEVEALRNTVAELQAQLDANNARAEVVDGEILEASDETATE